MTNKSNCAICGAVIETKCGRRIPYTCSNECKSERRIIINRWKKKLKEKNQTPKSVKTIDEVAAEARTKGMSYGQLVANEEKKKVKVIK